MSFIWPEMLLLLLTIPLGALLYAARERRRRARMTELGSLALAPGHVASTPGIRRRLPPRRRHPPLPLLTRRCRLSGSLE